MWRVLQLIVWAVTVSCSVAPVCQAFTSFQQAHAGAQNFKASLAAQTRELYGFDSYGHSNRFNGRFWK